MKPNDWLPGIAFSAIAVTLTGDTSTMQTRIPEVRAGQVLAKQIVDGEPHEYRIALKAGSALHFVVDQKGVDVVVKVTSPTGAILTEVDSPTGDTGSETVFVVARQNGDHLIHLGPLTKGASGAYELRVVAIRQATSLDERRVQSQLPSGPAAAKLLVAMVDGVIDGDAVFGAGIIVGFRDDAVYVATAGHVGRAGNLRVQFAAVPDRTFVAQLIRQAQDPDLALLRIPQVMGLSAENVPLRIRGDETRLRRGEAVHYMGSGGGDRLWRSNVTADHFSEAKDDALYFESLTVRSGISGGGLFNARWELVGMVVADREPEGKALSMTRVVDELHGWGFDTQLQYTVFHATWIAFMSNRDSKDGIQSGDTYVMRPDGSGLRRLTVGQLCGLYVNDLSARHHPTHGLDWARDGRSLIVEKTADSLVSAGSSERKCVSSEIYRVGTDGRQSTNLTNHPAKDDDPSWSPDGSKIAFTSDRSGNWEIYVMSVDGKRVVPLTRNTSNGVYTGLAWSPDSMNVVFMQGRPDHWQIQVARADGTRRVQLIRDDPGAESPAWSPDGKQIAFVGAPAKGAAWGLYVMDADGTHVRRVARSSDFFQLHSVSWSPDGARILFSARPWPELAMAVWVVDSDGGTAPVKLSGEGRNDFPVWSPDGSMVAFWSDRRGRVDNVEWPVGDICVVNADGSDERCLTQGVRTGDDHVLPSWSPFFR